jgi:hypothetical protein
MVYGETNQSVTDLFLSLKDKKLILDNYSEVFDFELKGRDLHVLSNAQNYIGKLNYFSLENKHVYVDSHLIEGTSLYYGDMLCDKFDQDNNMVNPPSNVGWYLYNLFGFSFDTIQLKLSNMLLNLCPITCELAYLDIIAQEFGLKRKDCWSDEKWRALIIHYYYNLETVKGIELVLNWIYEHNNRDNPEYLVEEITVDGQHSMFFLSDKFSEFNKCCDKFSEGEDRSSSLRDYIFEVHPHYTLEDGVISELMKIIRYGAVKDDC